MAQSICALTDEDRQSIIAFVRDADRAACGDSNDDEIDTLREALSECLRVLGIEVPDYFNDEEED